MRCRDHALVVVGWLLAGWAVAPLAAQPSSAPPGQAQLPPNAPTLVFDAETKHYEASPGELAAPFTFNVTNVWTNEIIIDRVKGSCSCTAADLPANPWHLPPQAGGEVKVQIQLAGKPAGLIDKTLTFTYRLMPNSITLIHQVHLTVNIPPPPARAGKMSEAERAAARAKAKADSQAIFKGECAACHADKGRHALGQDLYAADCGICHETSHRAGSVPDLHALKQPTDFDYWKTIITYGQPTNMMAAFAASQGGPLTEAQIISLATYLDHTISHHFSSGMTNAANAPISPAAAMP